MTAIDRRSLYRLTAIGILLLAFALRSFTLATRPLWFDEAWEYWIATTAFPELLPAVKEYLRDPPFYSYLLYFLVRLGEPEFWLRFPSLLGSMLNLLGVMTLARLAFGKPAALVAALLVAVAASDIRFAQEAGQYIFMACFLSWMLVFLLRFVQTGGWLWAGLWAIAAVLATYTHYGAPIPVIATALVSCAYLILGRRWRTLSVLAVAGIGALLLITPLVFDILPAQLTQPSNAIKPPVAFETLAVELRAFLTGAQTILRFQQMGHQPAGWVWPLLPEWVVWLPGLLLLVAGAVRYRLSMPFVWLIVSFILYFLISKSGLYHLDGRYTLIVAPLVWVCLAAGAIAMWGRQRTITVMLTGTIVLLSLSAPPERPEDLRGITQFWLAERADDEPTYVYYGALPGFRYQLRLAGKEDSASGVWFRECWWRGEGVAACNDDNIKYGRWIRSLSPEQKAESIYTSLGEEPSQFWIIFSHVYPGEDEVILTALGDSYTITKHLQRNGEAAVLLTHK
jgi:uncharacterized membrane protein